MMKKVSVALLAACCALWFAAPVEAKRAKPAPGQDKQSQDKQGQENQDAGSVPRYQPFPHNQTFQLKEINGKTPSVDMWIMIDSNGRGTGFSGCKNWSGIFVVGPDRLGPRAMPAVVEKKCDPALQALERDYWSILLNGPYWDTQGDDLILKGFKGGSMRFMRSL